MSTPEDLMTDAIEELENDHRLDLHERGEHDERRDALCSECEWEQEDAIAQNSWMGRSTFPVNPYAPDPEWTQPRGYVIAPLNWKGTLDAD